MEPYSAEDLAERLRRGEKRALAKAITLVESSREEHRHHAQELLRLLLPFTGNSVRLGITGTPGAGKSTFIESFGQLLLQYGKKIAVLAIDPSSTLNKGSILGDKTRMEQLSRQDNVFIRPSPSGGFLGGVANTTFETMLLCEAAGYNYILIETVGVGQSEVLAADLTDVFLYLQIAGGGDELQGIKRGIMERADLIFINKVTDENLAKAKNSKLELLRALHFLPEKEKGWNVPVLLGSALLKTGLAEVYAKISELLELREKSGTLQSRRVAQASKRFDYWVQEFIRQKMQGDEETHQAYLKHKENASQLSTNPIAEARSFVEKLFSADSRQ